MMVCHYLDNTQLYHDIDLTLYGVNMTTFIWYVHLGSNMKRNHYYLFVIIKMQGQIMYMYWSVGSTCRKKEKKENSAF